MLNEYDINGFVEHVIPSVDISSTERVSEWLFYCTHPCSHLCCHKFAVQL